MKLSRIRVLAYLLSLAPLLPAQQYVFHAYRQSDGLKNLAVRSLARDCDGYLWLATENGVFRFLGGTFEHFTREQGLPELGIQEVVADSSCTVWAGTTQNLYRFDGKRFVPATQQAVRLTRTHGMAVADAGHLLVLDKGHLFNLEHDAKGQFHSYTAVFSPALLTAFPSLGDGTSVSTVTASPQSTRVWMGAGNRLYTWTDTPGGTLQPTALTEWGPKNGLPEDHWQSVVVDHAGTTWAEGEHHIAALPSGAGSFVDHSLPTAAQGSFFLRSRLVVDNDGRVLAPTDDGVARWESDHWRVIDRDHGLPRNNQIATMIFDTSGDLWLGSYGDGLYNWAGYGQWEGWSDEKVLPSAIIWAMNASQPGHVIAGTDKGPAWIDPITGAAGSLVKGQKWLYGLIVAMGREPGGQLWAATNSGSVLRIDDHTGQTQQLVKLPTSILSAFEDPTGRFFLGTDHGIYVREPHGEFQRATSADAFLPDRSLVHSACQSPDGTNWFLANNRLLREKGGTWSLPATDGLPGPASGRLIALSCAESGELWVTGQRIGVWRLRPSGDHLVPWHLEFPAELHGLEAYSILACRHGLLWLGTDQGLLGWNGSTWRHLSQESGMIWNDVDEWGLTEAADGSVWVGTSGGLAHLLHPEHVFDPVALPIAITGLYRGTDEYPLGDRLDLPWTTLPLRLQLSSPTVRNRSDLVFRYQIGGLQSDWTESRDGLVVLSGVPPGDYNIAATAFNSSLNATSGNVRLHLLIRPPWWRKAWFITLTAIILGFLIALATRLYARKIRNRSHHLEALVRQRTKELEESRELLRIQATFDGLTGMLNRSAILQELNKQIANARKNGKPLILALTDVDHFKQVNDTYGHLTGDDALRRFASALRFSIRTSDSVGRYGGEEFLIILNDVPPAFAESRIAHLHKAISSLRVRVGEDEIRINCSIGATVFDPLTGDSDAETLLAIADNALYQAKAAGRNRVAFSGTAIAAGKKGRSSPSQGVTNS